MQEPEPQEAGLGSTDGLLPLLYRELRSIARRERRRVSGGETLATTALIHEAYLKFAPSAQFNDRAHFLHSAAIAMRHVLVDYARAQLTAKRGGGAEHVVLDEIPDLVLEDGAQVLAVHSALERLAAIDKRLVDVVECRFFAGYTEPETAEALGISERSVQRAWSSARSWLKRELAA